MSQFDQKQKTEENKTGVGEKEAVKDFLKDPILSSTRRELHETKDVAQAADPNEEKPLSDGTEKKNEMVFTGLRTAYENLNEYDCVDHKENKEPTFSKPSGRILSTPTLQLFRDALDDACIDSEVLDHTLFTSISQGSMKETAEQSLELLRSIQQSSLSSSIDVKPIHVCKEQSEVFGVSSGMNTLISSQEGSTIFSSDKIREQKGGFYEDKDKE